MSTFPLMLGSFPRAILHIDADAFFAACEQARDPRLRGKPVITGKERGIAASMSYEAKARGVTRGMRLSEIRQVCPDAIILPSDYETYSLLSKRFFEIVRRFTPDVEEYSIDECFADLTGMRRVYRKSYELIAKDIQNQLDSELGFTFSVGLAPTKVLAKVGSKRNKPSGLTVIPGRQIHEYLEKLPTEKVWGIGAQTSALMAKYGIKTALQFASSTLEFVHANFSKPYYEIWQELRGISVLPVSTASKTSYASIQKVKTFTPPSTDRSFVFSQLSKNIENACIKARRYKLMATDVTIFLRTQAFHDRGIQMRLNRPTAFPNEIITAVSDAFSSLFQKNTLYRSTGVTLSNLKEDVGNQPDLFGAHLQIDKLRQVYLGVDMMKNKYGKHALFLGSSFQAHTFGSHLGDRGDKPQRASNLFRGENSRQRLAVPMFTGDVT